MHLRVGTLFPWGAQLHDLYPHVLSWLMSGVLQLSPELATCAWVECLRFVRRAQSLKEARQVFVKASRAPDIGWQVSPFVPLL